MIIAPVPNEKLMHTEELTEESIIEEKESDLESEPLP